MSVKRLKRRIRKKPFLLLEVLISLTLVLLILGPLIKPLCGIMRAQHARAEQFEMERISRLLMSEIKVKLYKHEHSWSELEKGVVDHDLGSRNIRSKDYGVTYSIITLETHHKKNGDRFLLSNCQIALHENREKSHEFAFPILLEKKAHS